MTLNDKELFGDHNSSRYTEEVVARWGDTEAYAESSRRTRSYSKETWKQLLNESRAIEETLAHLMRSGTEHGDSAVLAALEDHRLHIDRWFYPCSVAMHTSLVEMYVHDQRFTAHYDAIEPGLAQFMAQGAQGRS